MPTHSNLHLITMAPSVAQRLCVIFFAAVSLYHLLFYTHVRAVALPELGNPALLQSFQDVGKRAEWSTDCTDTPIPTPTVAEQGSSQPGDSGAVTITVTVFVPATTSRTSTFTRSSSNVSSSASVSGVSSASTTSSSSVATPTQTPSATAGQQAQQLNLAYVGIQVTDSCTAGQRACINNMLAECIASSSGDTPKWVTQACPVTPSNEGMTCAAVPFVSSPSPSTTSSAPTSTPTGLAGYQPIPLSNSVAIGCFAKNDIAQRFSSAGVQGANGGMFPSGFHSGAIGQLQFRLKGTVGLALIAGLVLW